MEQDFKSERECNQALQNELASIKKRMETIDAVSNNQEREFELQQEIEHMRQQNEKQIQLIHKLLGQSRTPRSDKK